MKRFFLNGFFMMTIGCFALASQMNAQAPQEAPTSELKNPTSAAKKSFVLLELYTSEGCPTCPPADAHLARLEREQPFADAEIITLALHVDYWNSSVWKDVYSSPTFSRRQQIYTQALKTAQSYTPQMIVDGRAEFAGNNQAKARKAILEASKTSKATIEITPHDGDYRIKISGITAREAATVFLAVTEDYLPSNRKSELKSNEKVEHISVVRELKSLGMLAAAQTSLKIETALQIQSNWKKENLKLVVFVQENASRRILGASRIKII
jgi:hypothetical protein